MCCGLYGGSFYCGGGEKSGGCVFFSKKVDYCDQEGGKGV